MVLAACRADRSLAFSLGGDALWLGKVEQRMGQSNAFKLHYYRQQAQPKRGAAGVRACRPGQGHHPLS